MPGENNVQVNGGPGGWVEYRQRVLYQLDTLTSKVEALDKKCTDIHTDMVILKTKAGLWGGGVAVVISILVQLFMNFIFKK